MTRFHEHHALKICTPVNIERALLHVSAVAGDSINHNQLAVLLVKAHPFTGKVYLDDGEDEREVYRIVVLRLEERADGEFNQFVRWKTQVAINFGLSDQASPQN